MLMQMWYGPMDNYVIVYYCYVYDVMVKACLLFVMIIILVWYVQLMFLWCGVSVLNYRFPTGTDIFLSGFVRFWVSVFFRTVFVPGFPVFRFRPDDKIWKWKRFEGFSDRSRSFSSVLILISTNQLAYQF